jgi:hypothetical protein
MSWGGNNTTNWQKRKQIFFHSKASAKIRYRATARQTPIRSRRGQILENASQSNKNPLRTRAVITRLYIETVPSEHDLYQSRSVAPGVRRIRFRVCLGFRLFRVMLSMFCSQSFRPLTPLCLLAIRRSFHSSGILESVGQLASSSLCVLCSLLTRSTADPFACRFH